jgi:hypothetical protein
MGIEVFGAGAVDARLAALLPAIDVAARTATHEAGYIVERRAHQLLNERRHARGTPTPSPPGSPPARISGALGDSLRTADPQSEGVGRWVVDVAPDTPYAAIQETGGTAGRHHATVLPPRPYMRPAAEETHGEAWDVFYTTMAAALKL